MGAVTDAATGEVLGLDGFMEWLGDFARGFGGEAMVTDDISAYKPAGERLGILHQIRIAHVKKRV